MLTQKAQYQYFHEQGVSRPRRCAWLSHHAPQRAQVDDLNRRGYIVCPVFAERDYVRNHVEAWEAAARACGRTPALIVAVLPVNMLAALAHYAQPTPVWIAHMQGARWEGTWSALEAPYVALITTPVVDL